MAKEKIPCGGFDVDGATLVFGEADGRKILSTSAKDEYPNIDKVPCGGFYYDADVFKVLDGVLTKKATDSVSKTLRLCCGGYLCDATAFKLEDNVLSYIGK